MLWVEHSAALLDALMAARRVAMTEQRKVAQWVGSSVATWAVWTVASTAMKMVVHWVGQRDETTVATKVELKVGSMGKRMVGLLAASMVASRGFQTVV